MKLLPLLLFIPLAGCQVDPQAGGASKPTLRFRIHYQAPGLSTPHVEIVTTASVEAGRCVYVATPFGVAVNTFDPGGIGSVIIGPSAYFDAVEARALPGDIVALPGPTVPTQETGSGTIPNPGISGGKTVQVNYGLGAVFDTVNLLGTYEFVGGASLGAFRATVRNVASVGSLLEVYNFYVRRATGLPGQQPGMSCALP